MGEPLRILLVEDSEDDALLLLREIKKGGYESTSVRVETAEAMVRCLNEQTWDIVISDYFLPNFSAPEALKVLQESGLDLPFIIVSGKVDDEVAVSALTTGVHDFVRKDNMVRLIPAIKREVAEAIGRAEHEKAQIALKESESLLCTIAANFPNSYISIIEEDLTIGFTSGKEFKNQNLNPESFVGLTLEEVFKEQAPIIKEHYLKAFDGAETSFGLFINEQYQEYNIVPLFDENGEVHRILSVVENITERKRAEDALRASEEKYRQLIDLAQEGIWVIDKDANTSFVNPSMAEMLGYTADEMQGKHLFSFMDERGVEIATRNLERRQQGIKEQHDFEFLRKEGTRIDTTLETAPITDEAGNYIGAIAGVIDITERKRVEEALMESEEKYSSLFKNNHSIMLLIDPQTGNIVDANPSACAFYGYSQTELTQKKIYEINLLSDEEIQQEMDKAKLEQRNHFFFKHRLASGKIRDVEVYSAPITVQDKSLLYSIIHDITERKQAEEALRESEDKYRYLFEFMAQGVFYQSANGLMTDVNQAALDMLGLTRDQFLGRDSYDPAWNVISEDGSYLPPDKYPSRIALNTGKDVKDAVVGVFNPNINEYNWLTINAKPQFRDGEKNPDQLFVTLHDITKRKQAEDALKKSEQRLLRAQEVAHVGDWENDLETDIITWSDELYRIYGFEPADELKLETVLAGMHPEDRDLVKETLAGWAENGVGEPFEYRVLRPDGSIRYVYSPTDAVCDSTGKVVKLYGVSLDITERKRAEEALKTHTFELELNKKRLDASLRLSQMSENNLKEIASFVLNESVELTNSKFGFIGLMDENESILTIAAWTKSVMDLCGVIDKPLRFNVAGAGIWSEPLRQRKSVIINDYESTEYNKNGMPDDHVPILRLINIPIFEGDRIVALIAMANKEDEYNKVDAHQLKLLLEGMWAILRRKHAEDEKDALIYEISERTKELNVLYDISKLAAQTDAVLADIIELAVTIIPSGWQYPEITCARIILNENEYATANFAKTMWGQIAPIRVSGELVGSVEVYYLEDMPKIDEGPFYHEERDLINTVGHHLGSIAERKMAEDEILRFNSELEQRVKDRTVELEDVNKELVRLDKVKSEFMDTV
ncbi:MAG: PAS domain S-box protein, partial [Methanosarcinales archaeon]|nr:PAS domain S-box protein [Methanosarcinales archaeon]